MNGTVRVVREILTGPGVDDYETPPEQNFVGTKSNGRSRQVR